jgi:hypothetical protein
MAQTHKTQSEKATETMKATADRGTEVAQGMADNVQNLATRSTRTAAELQHSLAGKAAAGSNEIGRAMVDLLKEQAQHNLETMTALYATVDWDQVVRAVDWRSVARIQADFLHVSLMRASDITRRYLEVSQSMMAQSASVMERQMKKAS